MSVVYATKCDGCGFVVGVIPNDWNKGRTGANRDYCPKPECQVKRASSLKTMWERKREEV